jgi:DNA-binding transcriptional LysR family regulator
LRDVQAIDLNLLVAFDHLVREESVSAAAARMHLSAPAMSRTLGRLRGLLGDPVLVRAGRRLVATPRALALRDRVRTFVAEGQAIVQAAPTAPAATLERTFTIRSSDVGAGMLAAGLLRELHVRTPRVQLRFAPEGEEDAEPLRDGRVDLDLGVLAMGEAPELRIQVLGRERFVGVVRRGHPLARGRVTAARFAQFPHVGASRRGLAAGPIDQALRTVGITRTVAVVVPSFYAAVDVAARSDIVAAVPASVARHVAALAPIHAFELPVELPPYPVVQTWHPRFDADAAHRWLRACVVRAATPLGK